MAFVRSPGLRLLLAVAVFLCVGALLGAGGFYLAFLRDLPDLRSVDDYRPPLASRVYDRNGVQIGEFFRERRRLTPLEEIPEHVIDAFVAGEDSTFFEHAGLDFQAILRAAWRNLLAGGKVEGASTITQQTVKGLLLTPERTYRRKIREMILARELEQHFSKREILFLYLNQIYFGHGAYGIGQAARAYFDKTPAELTISEGAQLAGLPKAPSRYSPFANPDRAEQRRRYVLRRMLEDGLIDAEAHARALAEVPVLRDAETPDSVAAAAYFTEEVRRRLFDELGGAAVLEGGLTVETTLDAELQKAAVQAVQHGLRDLDQRQGFRGPLRHVAATEMAAELERLAEENGFLKSSEPEAAAEEDLEEDALPEEKLAAEEAPAETAPAEQENAAPTLPVDRVLAGVVTSVDAGAQRARVGFGAGREAWVRLADVSWAREPKPGTAPRQVRSIDAVFSEGDVAHFQVLEDPGKDAEEGEHYAKLDQVPIVQGSLLSLEVGSGDVLALVGGYDFDQSQFNRAIQARRQPGSAFKPIIYAAAISRDYTPASIVLDRPVVYTDPRSGFVWRPQNYGRSFYGPITLRTALARSVNNATVHLFRDVGVDYVIDFARKLGIESPLNRDLSLALGSSSLSLLELTRAYAVFPAQGRRVAPTFIRRVTDRDGRVLLENVPLDATPPLEESEQPSELLDVAETPASAPRHDDRVLSPERAYLVTDLLRAVVTDPKGTGWRLRALRRPVAGKTGTTNDQADAWFMGFSPDIVTGVWVGHDESRFLGWGETGSRAAAPIWVEFMAKALEGRPVRDFSVPEPIVFARIDRKTGLLADADSTETVFQAFIAGTEPTESARTARTASEGRRQLRLDAF
jgi:penicillin-binding protein 1A